MRVTIDEKNKEIVQLNKESESGAPEDQEMLEMYKEENFRLKDYMNKLNTENEELRRAQAQQDDLQI